MEPIHRFKRRRVSESAQITILEPHQSALLDSCTLTTPPEVIWPSDLVFELDAIETPDPFHTSPGQFLSHGGTGHEIGRHAAPSYQQSGLWDLTPQIRSAIPTIAASQDRTMDLTIPNPFAERSQNRHVRLRTKAVPRDGNVNGYIKLRIRPEPSSHQHSLARKRSVRRGLNQIGALPYLDQIPHPPPDFGRGFNLDEIDDRIFKFYLLGFCMGRTLLPQHNYWLHEVAPMMTQSNCVKYAVLAFAAGYVLDFVTTDEMRRRANAHYQSAIIYLDRALADPASHQVSNGDDVIAALLLLLAEDLVNHELSVKRDRNPRWWNGARAAKRILDSTDPGFRYWNPPNVQASKARVANANRVAFINILAEPLMPLRWMEYKELYGWLLEGNAAEVHCIHSGTGLSAKLLHTMAQVTFFSVRLQRHPDSAVYAQAASHLLSRLRLLRQHSELSPGYPSPAALFEASQSCLDHEGKVTSPAILVDLIGQSWVSSTEIYAQCRLFRHPRSHAAVMEGIETLTTCLELMPVSGELFTSQAPFFPIFLLGLVSQAGSRAREVSRGWFETVMAAVGSRSSVPPVWEALQGMWIYMDGVQMSQTSEGYDQEFADESMICDRAPWWEDMVSRLMEDYGVLSLY